MSEVYPEIQTKPPAAEANGQLIVALTTVIVLGILGGGMIVAGIFLKDSKEMWVAIAAITGGLINSLNSPTGIGSVLRASK